MLRYDVTYYAANGKRESGFDSNVSESYLLDLHKHLRTGETAYARCLSDPHEDREIDANGVRRAPR